MFESAHGPLCLDEARHSKSWMTNESHQQWFAWFTVGNRLSNGVVLNSFEVVDMASLSRRYWLWLGSVRVDLLASSREQPTRYHWGARRWIVPPLPPHVEKLHSVHVDTSGSRKSILRITEK